MKTGEKSCVADIRFNQKVTDKRSEQFQRKFNVNVERQCLPAIVQLKKHTCDVNQPYVDSYSMNCQRERTNLTIDIDPKTGNKKFIVDLNRFTGERFGYETAFNFSTREIETTYYTLVTSRMMKHRFGTLSVITAKQKDQEVQRITTSTADFAGYKIRFLSANIKLKIQLDSYALISASQVLGKIGSHNGLFGLETVKKSYKLQIGDAPLTVYDVQHWKTYLENIQVELLMMQMEIVYN
ncbi:unnamed protein product [Rotaria magnacalcarata]|uniref:Uncharacterized protein n=1 Tax=Rotaria magnacalcarata TaxID=392030 RepID=A0A815MBV6_9BILA|nr:unnamed protein product [Rotaria magnacalcarata]